MTYLHLYNVDTPVLKGLGYSEDSDWTDKDCYLLLLIISADMSLKLLVQDLHWQEGGM